MSTSQQEIGPGGVPVNARTSDYYHTDNLPKRFEYPGLFKGYEGKKQHLMYVTESSKYGSKPPTVHTVPVSYHPMSQKFSQEQSRGGIPRNYSFNTSMDKSLI